MDLQGEMLGASENQEKNNDLSSVTLFVVRHARTNYQEREAVKQTGRWDPTINDITPEGEQELEVTAADIVRQIDPQKEVAIFLSSPRARALSTQRVIERFLADKHINVGERLVVEALRSGGDNSPITGENNQAINKDGTLYDATFLDEEGSEETRGIRFRNFLSMFATIDKERLAKVIETSSIFKGKKPVFIAITHGEVLHAQGVPNNDYLASFLGQAFPDRLVKLSRGQAMRLNFDLTHPGDLSLSMPAQLNQPITALHYNSNNGSIVRK